MRDADFSPRSPDRHPDDLPPEPAGRLTIPRGVLWAMALFVVVLTIASWIAVSNEVPPRSAGESAARLGPGAPPASFGGLQVRDLSGQPAPPTSFETFAGTQTNLAALGGTPIVINFWASNCGPCVTEMPDFERVHQQYGGRVTFVGIDTVDGEIPARELARRTGVTYLLGWDRDGAIAGSFGVIGLPATILITRDGIIAYQRTGALSGDELTGHIEETLRP